MRFSVILLALSLAACAMPQKTTYTRLDGRSAHSDPALEQQAQTDIAICQGEAQKAWLSGGDAGPYRNAATEQVMDGCMASRGYRADKSPAY